jgi:hypothetical protein
VLESNCSMNLQFLLSVLLICVSGGIVFSYIKKFKFVNFHRPTIANESYYPITFIGFGTGRRKLLFFG